MNRVMSKAAIKLLVLTLATSASICCNKKTAESDSAASTAGQGAVSGAFTAADTDELLAPIALYPDPLLAQILPAATFIDQLEEAQKTLNGKSDDNLIANQSWDISVKSVAHYPDVLQMMTEKEDWTVALGQAYVNQPADVEKSIQNLRGQAQDAGNLVSSEQMVVETKSENGQEVIVVEPAQAEVIYVPQYNPEVVYVEPEGPSAGAAVLTFAAGLAMGAWLNRDWNWYGGGPYYHGWNGGGWIGRSASYANVNVNRNVYINDSYRNVNVNRNINSRNINNYRTDLHRSSEVRRQNTVVRGNSVNDRNAVRNADGVRTGNNDALRKDNRNLNNNPRDVNNRNTGAAQLPANRATQQPANRAASNRSGAGAGTSDVKRTQPNATQNRQATQANTSRGSASGSRSSAGTQSSGGSKAGGSKGGAAQGGAAQGGSGRR